MAWDHGEHNEQLCHQLNSQGVYLDWVVTTAFYACIHFIDHSLFPINVTPKQVWYELEDAKNGLPARTPHDARRILVKEYMADISSFYVALERNCKNARYIDYMVDEADAEFAIIVLEKIKKYCLTYKNIDG